MSKETPVPQRHLYVPEEVASLVRQRAPSANGGR
jgi:hypothetical protein